MKKDNKIDISLYEFIVNRQFGSIELGMSRAEILQIFPEPDDFMISKSKHFMGSPIWRYGNFEFHFEDDSLWMIFNDYLDAIDGGEALVLDPWIFRDVRLTWELCAINLKRKD